MNKFESMKPTMASRTQIMVEANIFIGLAAFKIMEESRQMGNAAMYERAQGFINDLPRGRR